MKEHIQMHLCAKFHACMIKCTHISPFCWTTIKIIINVSVNSFCFMSIPIYYGSTAIINIIFFQCGDRIYTSEFDVYRCQILTSFSALKGLIYIISIKSSTYCGCARIFVRYSTVISICTVCKIIIEKI